jgi:hypothetical protein
MTPWYTACSAISPSGVAPRFVGSHSRYTGMYTTSDITAMATMALRGGTFQCRASMPNTAHSSAAVRNSRSPIHTSDALTSVRLRQAISSSPAPVTPSASSTGCGTWKPDIAATISTVQNGMPPFTKTPAWAVGAYENPV